MDPRFEVILAEVSFGPCNALHLRFNDKLSVKVRTELSTNYESFFCGESDCAKWYRNHILMDELGSLVFMKHKVAPRHRLK